MSRTPGTPQARAVNAQVIEDHDQVGPDRDDEIDTTEDRGRRWYHLRPNPRRRSDLWGFNSTWWMALGWPLLVFFALSPWPWW